MLVDSELVSLIVDLEFLIWDILVEFEMFEWIFLLSKKDKKKKDKEVKCNSLISSEFSILVVEFELEVLFLEVLLLEVLIE